MIQTIADRFHTSPLSKVSGARWRGLGGLALMLAMVAQSARSLPRADETRLAPVAVLVLLMTVGWLLQTSRWVSPAIWLLGLTSAMLMWLLPGTGAAIGVIAAVVSGGLRMRERAGFVAAAVIVAAFVIADGASGSWSNPTNLVFNVAGLGFAYVAALSVRRLRLERERAETLLAELQRTRAAEIERAALAERARIAREIHDVLAHTLSALAVQLEGTRMLVEQRPGDPSVVAAVERAHRLASEGLAEARRAIGALRGDQLPGPDGLQRLVNEFSDATGTPSRFNVVGEPISLGSESQLALFRTAQEALTNVSKHARGATSVDVRLRYEPGGAELVVEDCAPSNSRNGSDGYGLVGMRERAELVGGSLEAGPSPGGFRVRLWLPRT